MKHELDTLIWFAGWALSSVLMWMLEDRIEMARSSHGDAWI